MAIEVKFRNAKYLADGRIDAEIEHPDFGWIPFTADPNDVEEHGRDCFAGIVATGNVEPYTPPVITPEQQRAMVGEAIESHMNDVARARGYRDFDRLLSYGLGNHPQFKPDAVAAALWRDAIWEALDDLEADIAAGLEEEPETIEELFLHLPDMEWPT